MISLLIFEVPTEMSENYRQAYDSQKSQLAMDNVAIKIGFQDEVLFNWIEKQNHRLEKWDQWHHLVHFCKSISVAHCKPLDLKYEAFLKSWQLYVLKYAQSIWLRNQFEAQREGENLDQSVCVLGRASTLPVRSRTCKKCQLQVGWEILKTSMSVRMCSRALGSLRINYIKQKKEWTHEIRIREFPY